MSQTILIDAITGKIQNELWSLGVKCSCQRLTWFTSKPIHAKSKIYTAPGNVKLDEPYITRLGFKTAIKLYEELKNKEKL